MSILFKNKNSSISEWDFILKHGRREFIKKKTLLFKQGEIGSGFYYIDNGLFKIFSHTSTGRNRILDIPGSGDIIGEHVLDQQPYLFTAVAIEDSVVYYFSAEIYQQLVSKNPSIMGFLADSIMDKVQSLMTGIESKALTSEQRVAYYLLKLSESYESKEINMTQQELADYIGLTRITIYKILKKWKEDQVINVENRMVYINKPEKLKEYTLF